MPNFERDLWELVSGEESHRNHPDTFWIPPLEDRTSLDRGDAVKLIFAIQGEEEDGGVITQRERMWVVVTEQEGDYYIGTLDNQRDCLEPSDEVYLIEGAEIPFRAEHVISIWRPPDDYLEWKLAQTPERTWPRNS